jgi:hypothetical protein
MIINLLKIFLLLAFCIGSAHASENSPKELRVQLPWTHNSQFTGLYVAEFRKHFEKEGIKVKLIEGSPEKDAAKELANGNVDISINGLAGAWKASQDGAQITNVAQIVTGSAALVVCRISSGVYGPNDIAGKSIGVFSDYDKAIVKELLQKNKIPEESVNFMIQQPQGIDLVNNKAACVTALVFDQYLRIMENGVPYSDLIVIDPATYNIPNLIDGVYVRTADLKSEAFRNALIGFIRAMRNGWRETRIAPNLAVEAVKAKSNSFDREHEIKGLESILTIIPSDPKKFGLLDIGTFQKEAERLKASPEESAIAERIWTHQIWNQLQAKDGERHFLTVATKHYIDEISRLTIFKILVFFGVFTYALSGVLEAVNRNYDLWGRFILAFLSGIGGGTLRDIIIGGDRLPFYYVNDYRYPLGIMLVVVVTSIIVAIYPDSYKSKTFKQVKKYSDVFGFSALAVAGAIYSITSNLPWFWAPVMAALTCAGGGMLRDIVINQEPATLKGVIYEEAAIVGGLFIVAGLFLSNYFEYSSLPEYITIFSGMVLIASMRLIVYRYDLRYPKFLGGQGASH